MEKMGIVVSIKRGYIYTNQCTTILQRHKHITKRMNILSQKKKKKEVARARMFYELKNNFID